MEETPRIPLVLDPGPSITDGAGAIAAGAAVLAIIGFGATSGSLSLFALSALAAAAFVAIGIFIGSRLLYWQAPTIYLDASPLHLGEDVQLVYDRRTSRTVDVPEGGLHLSLCCEEIVRWESGHGDERTTRRRARTVMRSMTTVATTSTPDGLRAEATVRVPLGSVGPTLDLPHHRRRWWIEAQLTGDRLPGDRRHYVVRVDPVVAEAQRARAQDTIATPQELQPPAPSTFARIASNKPLAGLLSTTVEPGGELVGRLHYRPDATDGIAGVRLDVEWHTEGDGDRDAGTVGTLRVPLDVAGGIDTAWRIRLPLDAPTSYVGELFRLSYSLVVRVDRRHWFDSVHVIPLTVVPRYGSKLPWIEQLQR